MIKNCRISIIITARNYSMYIKECIDSCFKQTVKPFEVIYCDDYSNDNSVLIAKKTKAKVLALPENIGVVKARNYAVDKSKGNILVHVDGDDVLPKDFLEKHLQVFDKTTPFVYCAAQAFGTFETFWDVFSWGTLCLWNRNFVNTSAMIWKDAFIKAGKWQETCEKTMWDWSLAIRLSRLGIPRKSPAVLNYRQHNNSWSASKEKTDGQLIKLSISIRRELVNMSIGLVYGGRISNFLEKWMLNLCSDIKLLNNKPQLIIVNNSESDISSIVNEFESNFSEIKIITGRGKIKFTNEIERRNKVAELLADCYNIIMENATGEIIHFREDDILSTGNSFKILFDFITDGLPVKSAAAGIYFNRNKNWQKFIGGNFNKENPRATVDIDLLPSKEPFKLEYTGTGYLFFWKELCPKLFKPFYKGIQAHDWAWCSELNEKGDSVWMLPDAIVPHYINYDEFLQPLDKFDVNPLNNYSIIKKKISEDNNIKIVEKIALNAKL